VLISGFSDGVLSANIWSHRYIQSSQEPRGQVLALSIAPQIVSNLVFFCLRSVMDFPPADLRSPLHFWWYFHGRTAFGTNRCVHSSQEPAEQVLVLGIGPLVVSHLFFYGIRSVVDFPLQIFGRLVFLAVESQQNDFWD